MPHVSAGGKIFEGVMGLSLRRNRDLGGIGHAGRKLQGGEARVRKGWIGPGAMGEITFRGADARSKDCASKPGFEEWADPQYGRYG